MAIPKGTLLAISITSFVYLGMAWLVGITVHREVALAMGCNMTISNIADNDTNCTDSWLLVNDQATTYCGECINEGGNCEYFALLNSFQVVEMISLVGPIITAGEVRMCCYHIRSPW